MQGICALVMQLSALLGWVTVHGVSSLLDSIWGLCDQSACPWCPYALPKTQHPSSKLLILLVPSHRHTAGAKSKLATYRSCRYCGKRVQAIPDFHACHSQARMFAPLRCAARALYHEMTSDLQSHLCSDPCMQPVHCNTRACLHSLLRVS